MAGQRTRAPQRPGAAVILAGRGTITLAHLPADSLHLSERHSTESPLPIPQVEELEASPTRSGTTIVEAERSLILKTLHQTRNNKTHAAAILGISLKTLHNKLKKYGAHAGG